MAVVAPDAESVVEAAALARTYDNPVYDDPWTSVQDYYDAMAYTEEYASPSSTAVARELDLPRGRVRAWFDGSKPDAVRGLEAARQHGWLPVRVDEPVFRGLNALAAWSYARGSIAATTYVPTWSAQNDEDRRFLDRAAELANCILDITRSGSARKTVELRPVTDAAVLGRVLAVLGVPRGERIDDGLVQLPEYLTGAPERVRREFVHVYLHNRRRDQSDTGRIRFQEDRPSGFRRSLAELIGGVTDESVEVSGRDVTVSEEAADAIDQWEPLLGTSS